MVTIVSQWFNPIIINNIPIFFHLDDFDSTGGRQLGGLCLDAVVLHEVDDPLAEAAHVGVGERVAHQRLQQLRALLRHQHGAVTLRCKATQACMSPHIQVGYSTALTL